MTSEPSLLRHLRAMDNYAFEMLVADIWEGFGYDTTVSQESNDKGLDVLAIHRETGERVAIQAKCYAGSNRIGRPAVQQYSSLYQQENADAVYIVSTGYYTDTAIESGRELGVRLIDGISLCREIADLEHGCGFVPDRTLITKTTNRYRVLMVFDRERPTVRWTVGLSDTPATRGVHDLRPEQSPLSR